MGRRNALRGALIAEFVFAWSPRFFAGSDAYWSAFPAHLQAHPDWLRQQPDQEFIFWLFLGIGIVYVFLQLGLFFGRAFCVVPYVLMQVVGIVLLVMYASPVQSGLVQACMGLAWLSCGWVLALLFLTDVLKVDAGDSQTSALEPDEDAQPAA